MSWKPTTWKKSQRKLPTRQPYHPNYQEFSHGIATTEGYKAYYPDTTTWRSLVAGMLRGCDDTYQTVMSMARQKAFQELHMQRSQMIDQLTVGPFQLYYCKGKHNIHLSVVNCPKHISGSDCTLHLAQH